MQTNERPDGGRQGPIGATFQAGSWDWLLGGISLEKIPRPV